MLEIMPKKLSQNKVIERFREVHGDFYDYSKVKYVNDRTKVCIICPLHGEFWQEPQAHYRQRCGCPICGINKTSSKKNIGLEKFIERANIIHDNKYDYSKTKYITSKIKVCITCPDHGDFWQTPNSHLMGKGCSQCANIITANKNRKYTEYFIKLARSVHGNRYLYDKSVYVSNQTKITITCREHGDFEQLPANHTQGAGCPKCKSELISTTRRSSTEEFISKARMVHGMDFDYSLVVYNKKDEKVKIRCNKCGRVFEQTPNSHLYGTGCPHCQSSKGEDKIAIFLSKNNISYKRQQQIFSSDLFCRTKMFKVDFYLPNNNIIIEYNGEQHYIPIKHFGGEEKFEIQHERDLSLRQYCEDNKIKLIEIPYTEFGNIEKILTEELKINKKKN